MDETVRLLEREAQAHNDETTKRALARVRCRIEGCKHKFLGSACVCGAPDPRTVPGKGAKNRYGVRRFVAEWFRPGDAHEVFDRVTGECCSPGMARKHAEREAAMRNACHRKHEIGTLPVIACFACGFKVSGWKVRP